MSEKKPNADASDPSQPQDLALIAKARRQAAALDDSDLMLDAPPGGNGFIGPPPDSFTGYRIIKEVHRGGQGVVYQAVQESTSRKVAIKVMRQGPFADSSDRARFDREVQILGQLNHANIVSIHDRGTAAGCEYFVMDYVSGQPLDVYMASGERTIDESLRLFQNICDAINAAHLRGVIHRDIKPSNIRIDADGRPHILDFGLAKMGSAGVPSASGSVGAGAPSLPGVGDGTVGSAGVPPVSGSVGVSPANPNIMTITGQFIGSLPWASPEQAEAIPSKIDIRTDVYSLGVVLYQMLTGKFPYEVVGNMRDVLGRIIGEAPQRPRAVRREINDEVETIILKCLAKEPERRYQSAGELGRDVKHYLAGEPIEAKRDSPAYVLRKQLSKYKLSVAVATAFIVITALGFAVSLAFWRQAVQQRDVARTEAQKARQIERFLQNMLASADPVTAGGRDTTILREMLAEAATKAETEFADEPEVQAAVLDTIGTTYQSLGLYDEAEPRLRAALTLSEQLFDHDHPERLASINNMGVLLELMGKYAEAEPYFREALESRRRVLGNDHPKTLHSISNMGSLLKSMGKHAEAERYAREALERQRRVLGDNHPDTLLSCHNLGLVLAGRGKFAEAAGYVAEALEGQRRELGDDHPLTLTSMSEMGFLLHSLGKPTEAEPYFREALDGRRRILGDDHPDTLNTINNLGGLLHALGRYAEAQPYFRQALESNRRVLGDDHPSTLTSINNMGSLLQSMGKLPEAEPYFREALESNRRVLGDDHPSTLTSINNMGVLLHWMGKLAEAEPYYREALSARRRALGNNHPSTLNSLNSMGSLLNSMDNPAQPEPLLVEAVEVAKRTLPKAHWRTGTFLTPYGECLTKLERYAEAERALLEAVEILETALGPKHARTRSALKSLTGLYEAWPKPEKASDCRAKLEAIDKNSPEPKSQSKEND